MLQKVIKAILCVLLLLLSIEQISSPKAHAQESVATINTSILNVREGPGLSYNVIKKVKLGEKFPIVEKNGEWLKIKLATNQHGWVAAWLIKEESTTPNNTTSTVQSSTVIANVDGLRMRSGPGTSFQITGFFDKGKEATFIEKNENWIKIKHNNNQGWVASEYIIFKQNQGNTSNSGNSNEVSKTGKITATVLNIRSQPDTKSSVVGKLVSGDTVKISGEKNSWFQIEYNNLKVWIHSDYVKIDAPTEPQQEQPTPATPPSTTTKTGKVSASSLNVRSEGSLAGSVVASLNKGNKVTILSEANNWYEVSLQNGNKGWVASWYIELLQEQPVENTKPTTSPDAMVKILHNGTNIRSAATTSSSVVARANEGDQFTLITTEGDWYKIKLADNKEAYVAGWIVEVSGNTPKVERPGVNQYLKDKTIIIDPGHGGNDSGAIGAKGTLEKNLNLRTSKLVYDKLRAAGANVFVTRNTDIYISLASRVSFSHYRNADAFISVHYDSVYDSSVKGITSYYYKSADSPVASSIQSELIKYTGLKDRGHRIGNYQVLRTNRQPSTLLELGFLSNPSEELTVNSSTFQERVSNGIFYGLAQYFKDK